MKTWKTPIAVAQRFAANEYVSACTFEVMCSLELPAGAKSLMIPAPFDYNSDGVVDDNQNLYYDPCGTKHTLEVGTEFYDYTFTKASTTFNINGVYALEKPIQAKFWVELDSQGRLYNAHFVAPENLENVVANKS